MHHINRVLNGPGEETMINGNVLLLNYFICFWLFVTVSCSRCWPWTSDPPTTTFQVLWLQGCSTILSWGNLNKEGKSFSWSGLWVCGPWKHLGSVRFQRIGETNYSCCSSLLKTTATQPDWLSRGFSGSSEPHNGRRGSRRSRWFRLTCKSGSQSDETSKE